MARKRYRDPEYKRAVAHWTLIIARHDTRCCARLCLFGDRTIPAGADRATWDMGHDPTGTIITGPEHARCNRHEGAVRGNTLRGMRGRTRRLLAAQRTPTAQRSRVSVNQW